MAQDEDSSCWRHQACMRRGAISALSLISTPGAAALDIIECLARRHPLAAAHRARKPGECTWAAGWHESDTRCHAIPANTSLLCKARNSVAPQSSTVHPSESYITKSGPRGVAWIRDRWRRVSKSPEPASSRVMGRSRARAERPMVVARVKGMQNHMMPPSRYPVCAADGRAAMALCQ